MTATERRALTTVPAPSSDPQASSTAASVNETAAAPFAYLLRLESDARRSRSLRELDALFVNEFPEDATCTTSVRLRMP